MESLKSMASSSIRSGHSEERILRFLFQSGHLRNRVKKQGVNVAPHPDTGRLELSMFLLNSLSLENFWEDMPRLGDRHGADAKGFGSITCGDVRRLSPVDSKAPFGLDVEVNNNPVAGHCDVIHWSDDPEERMSQQIVFAKNLDARKRPDNPTELTPEQEFLRKLQ